MTKKDLNAAMQRVWNLQREMKPRFRTAADVNEFVTAMQSKLEDCRVSEEETPQRQETGGRDRMERGGRDRAEGSTRSRSKKAESAPPEVDSGGESASDGDGQ